MSDKNGQGRMSATVERGLSRRSAVLALGGSMLALAGCVPSFNTGPSFRPVQPLPTPLPQTPTGEVLGSGSVRVALLLPRSAQGNAAGLAAAMRNAAELGLRDFTGADVTVLVKDTGGRGDLAAAAAQSAIAEGAELILGPVFADEVRQVGPIANAANVPVIAFSSDPSVAQPGTYIMGFLVDDQVRQMMDQAAATNLRSMAALISGGAYGTVAEAALREAAPRRNIRLVQIERFSAADAAAKVSAIAANRNQIDSIFMPDGPGTAPQLAGQLAGAGIDLRRVRLIGSGQWNDASVYTSAALTGGWFPAPEISGFQTFAQRYRAAFGSDPQLTATLAYDAVVLAAGLVRAAGAQRFQRSVIANPEGFISGVNGLFRFNADGTNDRGLAVYEVTGSSPRLIRPAPRAFTGF